MGGNLRSVEGVDISRIKLIIFGRVGVVGIRGLRM